MDLLIVVPHPDDEVFGAGGVLYEYAQQGRQTGLITLTRGDMGKDLGLATRETLPEVREAELRKAAEVLCIGHLEIYRYPDKGVERHPEIVDLLVQRFAELKPKAIITFPPNGVNQHPDHVATHRWVRAALERYGQPVRLFYYSPENPMPEHREGWLAPNTFRPVQPVAFGYKIKAMAQHKTQALSVLSFMERFPDRLQHETFHLEGYQGPRLTDLL